MSKTLGQRLADLNIEVGTAMTIDWAQVRIQAAMYAMQGQLANQVLTENMIESVENVANFPKVVANASVRFADALIEELKKGGQDETK
jgi:hypothetical protein